MSNLSDVDHDAFLRAVDTDPSSWPILRLRRGENRLHVFYDCSDEGVATLRGEVNGTPMYSRTFIVTVSAGQTAADLRGELRRFRQEQAALGWVEVPPLLCLEEVTAPPIGGTF